MHDKAEPRSVVHIDRFIDAVLRAVAATDAEIEELRLTHHEDIAECRRNLEVLA